MVTECFVLASTKTRPYARDLTTPRLQSLIVENCPHFSFSRSQLEGFSLVITVVGGTNIEKWNQIVYDSKMFGAQSRKLCRVSRGRELELVVASNLSTEIDPSFLTWMDGLQLHGFEFYGAIGKHPLDIHFLLRNCAESHIAIRESHLSAFSTTNSATRWCHPESDNSYGESPPQRLTGYSA
jgi:hypothetical protein